MTTECQHEVDYHGICAACGRDLTAYVTFLSQSYFIHMNIHPFSI
jgi:hypothetical protein